MVLATLGEIGLVAAGTLNFAPIEALIAVHVAIGLSLVLVCVPRSSRSRGNPEFLLFILCIVMMGPLGPFGTAFTIALHRKYRGSATSFDEWYASLFPEVVVTRPQALYRLIVLRDGGPPTRSTAAPFLDIMAFGTVVQKRAVIAMIAAEFRASFAPALQGALNDADPAIRVQAASAVAYLDASFVNRAMTLQTRCAAHPDDADAILQLACHREAYAESGLLDESRARAELTEALACYERVNAIRPADAAVVEAIARLLVQVGRSEEALLRLGPLIARSHPSAEAVAEYLECLFRRGNFAQVREACRLFSGRVDPTTLPDCLADALRLWSGDTADELHRPIAGAAPA
jgi:hypothetical protein